MHIAAQACPVPKKARGGQEACNHMNLLIFGSTDVFDFWGHCLTLTSRFDCFRNQFLTRPCAAVACCLKRPKHGGLRFPRRADNLRSLTHSTHKLDSFLHLITTLTPL